MAVGGWPRRKPRARSDDSTENRHPACPGCVSGERIRLCRVANLDSALRGRDLSL
jgi:hypothetical protein